MLPIVVLAVVAIAGVQAKSIHYAEWDKPDLNQTVTFTDNSTETRLEAFDQVQAYRFLLYSYAAYLTGSVYPWTCSYCKYSAAVSTFQTYTTMSDSLTDAFGFIGYNPQFNEIVISFRGSSSLQNWILNLQFYKSQTPFGGGSGGVASGFYAFWVALRSKTAAALETLVKRYPTAQIYTTGHSLGGAAAALAAVDLKVNYGYNSIKVLTYGEPRVGDPTFASFANSRVGQFMRMTHADDIVVHLPPALFNFDHETQEIWATSSGYRQCSLTNGEDPNCSDSVHTWEFSVSDHLSYMGVSCCKGPNMAIILPEHLTLADRGEAPEH